MNILLLNGSLKKKASTSNYLLEYLKDKFNKEDIIEKKNIDKINIDEIVDIINNSDIFILAFPLYVDSIPASVIEFLYNIEDKICNSKLRVYGIVNCGFYEARQNMIALSILELWCKNSNVQWSGGIGIGGGGMAQTSSIGEKTSKDLGKILDSMVKALNQNEEFENKFVEMNFPRFLYKSAAHIGWKMQGKKNGIKVKELYRKCV